MKKKAEANASDKVQTEAAEFAALFNKCNKHEPAMVDKARFELLLRQHKDAELWRQMPGPGETVIRYLLEQNIAGYALSRLWRFRVDELKAEFGYEQSSGIERMLIEHIILCWLQLNFVALKDTAAASTGEGSIAAHTYINRRLSAAQRRFTRATDALARTRALLAAARYATARADEAERQRLERRGPHALRA